MGQVFAVITRGPRRLEKCLLLLDLLRGNMTDFEDLASEGLLNLHKRCPNLAQRLDICFFAISLALRVLMQSSQVPQDDWKKVIYYQISSGIPLVTVKKDSSSESLPYLHNKCFNSAQRLDIWVFLPFHWRLRYFYRPPQGSLGIIKSVCYF